MRQWIRVAFVGGIAAASVASAGVARAQKGGPAVSVTPPPSSNTAGQHEDVAAPPSTAPLASSGNEAPREGGLRDDYSRGTLEDLADQGQHKTMALEVSPIAPLVGQWGGAVEVMPVRHHALILSAYYYATRTGPVPQNLFRGIGAEIGYRYYMGGSGPRGIFLGPSLLLGAFNAQGSGVPGGPDPASIGFYNLGMALDVGYQAVVADSFLVGIGVGGQTEYVTKTFPDQEWPSSVHTNSRVYPRLLVSFGWAFNP